MEPEYGFFSVWLLPLNVVPVSFIHVVINIKYWSSILVLCCTIFHRVHLPQLLICSLLDAHSGGVSVGGCCE